MFARCRWPRFLNAVILACCLALINERSYAETPSERVATVNGQTILQRDVDLELLLSGAHNPRKEDRESALERVIDRTLIMRSITTKNADPLADDVENRVDSVRKGIESGGETMEAVLTRLQLTEEDVRQSAKLAVNWQAHVQRSISDANIRQYFDAHRSQLDGTRVHLFQIVRTVSPTTTAADWTEAEKQLNDLRSEIESGQTDFATAAKIHSQSPSAQQGGDVGLIRFRGDVPPPVSTAAFERKVGEIGPPVQSNVGVHLLLVTERLPGDLSLEDARPVILEILGQQLWDKTVKSLRAKAKIERK